MAFEDDDAPESAMKTPTKHEIDRYLADIGRYGEERKSWSAQAGQRTNLFSEQFSIEKGALKIFATLAKKERAICSTWWRQVKTLMEAAGLDDADLFEGTAQAQAQAPAAPPAPPAGDDDAFDPSAEASPPTPPTQAEQNAAVLGAGITKLDPNKPRRGRPPKAAAGGAEGTYKSLN